MYLLYLSHQFFYGIRAPSWSSAFPSQMLDTPPISPKKSSSSPKHDAGSGTVTTDPTLNPSSPYFIHPSEGPSSVSITPILDGTNYHSWSKAFRMALISKNKMAFILGTLSLFLLLLTHFTLLGRDATLSLCPRSSTLFLLPLLKV